MIRAFLIFAALFVGSTARAEIYTTSSNQVDVCKGYNAPADVSHHADKGVNLNSFDFGFDNKVIKIPIEYQALQALGISNDVLDNLDSKADLGVVEIYPDGRVMFGDQNLSASSLEALCKERDGAPLIGQASDIIEGQDYE